MTFLELRSFVLKKRNPDKFQYFHLRRSPLKPSSVDDKTLLLHIDDIIL